MAQTKQLVKHKLNNGGGGKANMLKDGPEFFELLEDVDLELLVLVWHETKFGHERGRVDLGLVVANLG